MIIRRIALAVALMASTAGIANAADPSFYMRERLQVGAGSGQPLTPGSWTYSAWADSTACVTDTKQQSRTPICVALGKPVAANRCADATESLTRSVTCIPTGQWNYSAWGDTSACSNGSKIQARNASCIDGGTAAPDTQCASAKGALVQNAACATTGQWSEGSTWTDITGCVSGSRTQTHAVTCVDGGANVGDGQCSSAGAKPSSTRTQSCTPPGTWNYSSWTDSSQCATTPNGFKKNQTRTGVCKVAGATVADDQCDTKVVSQETSCTMATSTCNTLTADRFPTSGDTRLGNVAPAGTPLEQIAWAKNWCENYGITVRACAVVIGPGYVYISTAGSGVSTGQGAGVWGASCTPK